MSHCSNKHQQKMMMLVKDQKQHNKMMPTLANTNKEDMRDLEEMFSQLNPMAQEFVPHQHRRRRQKPSSSSSSSAVGGSHATAAISNATATSSRKKGNNNKKSNGKKVMSSRTGKAQTDDAIKRTVYVSNLHHLVTEAQVADLFVYCGQVVDCRVCGNPKSPLRFAFIEFTDLGMMPLARLEVFSDTIDDTAASGVVAGDFNLDIITGEHTNGIASDFTRDVTENNISVLQTNPKHSVWKRLRYQSFCHPLLFCAW